MGSEMCIRDSFFSFPFSFLIPLEEVHAPRTQAAVGCETENASLEVGADDACGRGYKPHTLQQRLQERPAESVRPTPAEGGTGPTHSSSETGCERWVSVPWVGTDDVRRRGYRPLALKQRQAVRLNERPARRYRRLTRKGVQAPRTQTGAAGASRGVVPRGRYRRHPRGGTCLLYTSPSPRDS